MLRRVLPILCVVAVMILIGCGGTDNTNAGNTNANHANVNRASTNTTNTAPTNTAATNSTTADASGEKIGVAECDDFIAKYDACVSGKVPAAARAQFQSSVKEWRDSWRKLAANPQTKGTLAQVCKTSMESSRASMKSFGCEF
ncbi:MAG: hypothetical protein QOE33_448 [Acidobacteriota bacterium]|nr:hypothetical protein [Acidobacteriota bacterium]